MSPNFRVFSTKDHCGAGFGTERVFLSGFAGLSLCYSPQQELADGVLRVPVYPALYAFPAVREWEEYNTSEKLFQFVFFASPNCQ